MMKRLLQLLLLSFPLASYGQLQSIHKPVQADLHYVKWKSLNLHTATLKSEIGFTKWEKASYELDSGFLSVYGDYFGYMQINQDWSLSPFLTYNYSYYSDLDVENNPEHRGVKVSDMKQDFYIQLYLERKLADKNRLTFGIHYSYIDDFFDPTVFETEIYSIKYKSHTASYMTEYAWKLTKKFELKNRATIEREFIHNSNDDLNRYSFRSYLYWNHDKRTRMLFGYKFSFYDYDDRVARENNGTKVENRKTRTSRNSLYYKWDQYWGKNKDLRTKFYLSLGKDSDHYKSYYEYMRYSSKFSLKYDYGKWEFKLDAKVSYKEYDTKTVENGDKKWLLYYRASQTTSYKLKENLLSYVKYELYDDHSNEIYDKRTEHWFKIGIEWEI